LGHAASLLAGLAILLTAAASHARQRSANSPNECDDLWRKHRTIVRSDARAPTFATKVWSSAYVIEPIGRRRVPGACIAIRHFRDKYPSLVDQDLVSVNLVGELSYERRYFMSGTYTNGVIFLKAQHSGHTPRYLERVLHHEFSSILMSYHGFPSRSAWERASAKPYGHDYSMLERGRSYGARAERIALLRDGFIVAYATTDFENDVNSCAEYLWTMPKRFANLGRKYPKIGTKRRLMITWYDKLKAAARRGR